MTEVTIVNRNITGGCTACGGSGKRIVDWNAYNQLSVPVGLSSYARAEWEKNFKKAYSACPACRGTGKTDTSS